jgi:hypothetical protein
MIGVLCSGGVVAQEEVRAFPVPQYPWHRLSDALGPKQASQHLHTPDDFSASSLEVASIPGIWGESARAPNLQFTNLMPSVRQSSCR